MPLKKPHFLEKYFWKSPHVLYSSGVLQKIFNTFKVDRILENILKKFQFHTWQFFPKNTTFKGLPLENILDPWKYPWNNLEKCSQKSPRLMLRNSWKYFWNILKKYPQKVQTYSSGNSWSIYSSGVLENILELTLKNNS